MHVSARIDTAFKKWILIIVCKIVNLYTSVFLPSTTPFSGDANPSPNTYTLPQLIGPRIPNRSSSACYSLAGKIKLGGFDTDYARTPGPARYETATPEVTQRKAPAYSLQGRCYMPGGEWTSST